MSSSLTYKIIHDHLVRGELVAGEPIEIRIDQTLTQDVTGTMAFLELEAMGTPRVRTELSVSYIDHNTTQFGPNNRNDHRYLQSMAAKTGVYLSRAGNGICHQVHEERFAVPGKTLLGSDSHTPTAGGVGMLAIGAGGLDVAIAMAGGPFRLACPRVIGVRLTGELPEWVSAKDAILEVLSILSTRGNVGCVLEYFGPGIDRLSVPDRCTITNMGAETGVTTSVFPSDDVTRRFLEAQKRGAGWTRLAADPDAVYDRVLEIALDELVPMVASPSSPDHVKTVAECADTPVAQVVVGSCTNSSFRDLSVVAAVLRGKTVHPNVSFAVAPGSRQVLQMIAQSGALKHLIDAGARILECACGPCLGQGQSPGSGAVSLRTINRNFAGRSGTANDRVYLVSPETAAAAVLTGAITDPRDLGLDYPRFDPPEAFLVDDSMIIAPPERSDDVEVARAETIGDPPTGGVFPDALAGPVLIRVGDKVTTDHIMPAGVHLKLRSNIPAYSRVVFEPLNEPGRPTFAERAAQARDRGEHGVIVAGDSYGQGSSREHAAICPMYLGVRLVIAKTIERIHAANLVNFGILPLLLAEPADYQTLRMGDRVEVANVADQLRAGPTVRVRNVTLGHDITCRHDLTDEDVDVVLAGGRLNSMRHSAS